MIDNIPTYGARPDQAAQELAEAGFTKIDELRGCINRHIQKLVLDAQRRVRFDARRSHEAIDDIEYAEGATEAAVFAQREGTHDEALLGLITRFGYLHAVLGLELELSSLRDQF